MVTNIWYGAYSFTTITMAPLLTLLKVGKFLQQLILAVFIGVVVGILAVAFFTVIGFLLSLFYGYSGDVSFVGLVSEMPWYQRLAIPALGGLLVGALIRICNVSEAAGHGVSEVMESVALEKGKMRFRVAPVKILTAAITIGTGGSGGREGPIVQAGSAVGSNLGRWLKFSDVERRTLLAVGAAAGVSGAFFAPLAGVIFAWEILLRRMTVPIFVLLTVAAIVSNYVSSQLLGVSAPFFGEVDFGFVTNLEYLLLAGLAIVAAWVAIFYDNAIYLSQKIFSTSRIPFLFRPMLGGFLLGTIALFVPLVHEPASHPFMVDTLQLVSLGFGFLLLLIVLKVIATALTIGSGGSGGIFAPALMIGLSVGAVYGVGMNFLFPNIDMQVESYALLGMAAVFAAAAHAPFAAAVIVYEMTGSVAAVIPLLITCVIAAYTAKFIQKTNIYSQALLLDDSVDIDKVYKRMNDRLKKYWRL